MNIRQGQPVVFRLADHKIISPYGLTKCDISAYTDEQVIISKALDDINIRCGKMFLFLESGDTALLGTGPLKYEMDFEGTFFDRGEEKPFYGNETVETTIYVEGEDEPVIPDHYYTKDEIDILLSGKQDTLVCGENIKTINEECILGSGNMDIEGGGSCYPFDTMAYVYDYLYEAEYSELDYPFAKEWFKNNAPIITGGCTSVVSGNTYGRNLDWLYSNEVDFIIHNGDTLGVAGGLSGLSKDFVESRECSDLYKIIPFMLQDGINSNGVFANINVVAQDDAYGTTTYTIPAVEKRDEISALMLVRYIIDHFDTAEEAVDYIRDYVSVYMPTGLTAQGYEVHYMVGDKESSYVIEFINGEVKVLPSDILSNFYLYGTSANTDGTYYSIADEGHTPSTENGLKDMSSGVERYNIAREGLNNGDSIADIMNELLYTKTYTKEEDIWYSEYVGGALGIDNAPEDFAERIAEIREQYTERDRENPITWQTCHGSVYDLDKLTLDIISQENERYSTSMGDDVYTKDEVDALLAEKVNNDTFDAAVSAMTVELDSKATNADLAEGLAGKQEIIPDLANIKEGAGLGLTALQSGDVKTINGQSIVGSGDIVISGTERQKFVINFGDGTSLSGDQEALWNYATVGVNDLNEVDIVAKVGTGKDKYPCSVVREWGSESLSQLLLYFGDYKVSLQKGYYDTEVHIIEFKSYRGYAELVGERTSGWNRDTARALLQGSHPIFQYRKYGQSPNTYYSVLKYEYTINEYDREDRDYNQRLQIWFLDDDLQIKTYTTGFYTDEPI